MKRLVIVLVFAVFAPATVVATCDPTFPRIAALLYLHRPGNDTYEGLFLFWRRSENPTDFVIHTFVSPFDPSSNDLSVAMVYNTDSVTNECHTQKLPLLLYNEELNELSPSALFFGQSSDGSHDEYIKPWSNTTLDLTGEHSILNRTVIMYTVSANNKAVMNQFIGGNPPAPILCGVIEPIRYAGPIVDRKDSETKSHEKYPSRRLRFG